MKFGQYFKNKLGALLVVATFLSALAAVSVPSFASGADESVAKKAPEVVASLRFSGTDDLWNNSEKIADVMKYKEILQGVRGLLKIRAKMDVIDPSREWGVVVATDGDTIAAFGYLPLANPEEFDDLDVAEFMVNVQQLFKTPMPKLDAYVESGFLLIFNRDQDSIVTSLPFESYGAPKQEGDASLLSLDINFDALPKELVEAGAALVRQKLAEIAENESAYDQQSVDHALAKYSDLINSLKQLRWSFTVDNDANLVSDLVLTTNPESPVAESLVKTSQTQTKWNAIAETPNAILAAAEAGVVFSPNLKGDVESLRKSIHDNLLNSLDILIDDPENFEIAKEIVGHVEEALVANLESEVYDNGLAVASDPLSVIFANSCAAPDQIKTATDLLIKRLKKTNPELAEAFKEEKVVDYDVTSVELELNSISDELPTFLKGKTLTVKYGVNSDSLLVVASFDASHAMSEFTRVAESSREKTPQKNESFYDLSQLAKALQIVLASYDNVRPQASRSVDAFANAEDAKIVFTREFRGNVVELKSTVKSDFFKALGDVMRINFMSCNGDEGEDVDDLFNDEE
ncbi:MAG: hypothetical protein IJL92_08855 [Thermoguttaceae bacterium]|nr:hypothetical protein [Thermoguttaceae bacterium]